MKQNASAVVARAEDGETVTITDRGRPVAQLTPVPTSHPVAFYLDTSARVKLMVAEPETEALLRWLEGEGREPVSCDLARTELLRAVRRAAPERSLRARVVLDSITIVAVTSDVFSRAACGAACADQQPSRRSTVRTWKTTRRTRPPRSPGARTVRCPASRWTGGRMTAVLYSPSLTRSRCRTRADDRCAQAGSCADVPHGQAQWRWKVRR